MCSGIEAASVAWGPLGWEAVAFSEIEALPRAVLKHRFPDVPLHGDFTTIKGLEYGPVDVLVGGTPCQSFSVAGLRKGLDDPRGNLALAFLGLLDRTRARWVVWENVPGVLSSTSHDAPDPSPPPPPVGVGADGAEMETTDEYESEEIHAFNSFLAGLSELGYGWAYRVLDAQYAGVPQRRRRVFVVGYLGDWRRAAAVLFERHSLQGHSPPRREAGESAPTLPSRSTAGGGLGTDFDCDGGLIHAPEVSCALKARDYKGPSSDASEDGTGRGTPLMAFGWNKSASSAMRIDNTTDALQASPTSNPAAATPAAVRRILPVEAERLQGFPDGWTAVPYRGKPADQCADGPRYKALGNSMTVPVVRWIGERIKAVEAVAAEQSRAA